MSIDDVDAQIEAELSATQAAQAELNKLKEFEKQILKGPSSPLAVPVPAKTVQTAKPLSSHCSSSKALMQPTRSLWEISMSPKSSPVAPSRSPSPPPTGRTDYLPLAANPLLVNDFIAAQAKVDQLRARLTEAEGRLDAGISSRAAQVGVDFPSPWFDQQAPAGAGMAVQLGAPRTQIEEHVLEMPSSAIGTAVRAGQEDTLSLLSSEFYWSCYECRWEATQP